MSRQSTNPMGGPIRAAGRKWRILPLLLGLLLAPLPARSLLFPVDGSATLVPFPSIPNDDQSANLPLGFGFNLYGDTFDNVYVNNNGNLSFGTAFSTFTATGFPSANFRMVAAFWADVDTRAPDGSSLGEVVYQTAPNRLVVTWNQVGYYARQGDLRNTFQIAISDGSDPMMGIGNNVCFSYDDMQWTTGSASGGSAGFGGTPATVGANRGNGVDFFQIGRFDRPGTEYDGPVGNPDGVSFLDGRLYCFRTSTATNNIDPIPGGFPAGNTLNVNPLAGQSVSLDLSFLSPEAEQTTSVVVTDLDGAAARGMGITNAPGNPAAVTLRWNPTCPQAGTYRLDFLARDDFVPAGETSLRLNINVSCETTPGPGTPTPTRTPTPRPTGSPVPGCDIYEPDPAAFPAPILDLGQLAVPVEVDRPGLVTSVTILDLRGRHTFLQDLEVSLLSPDLREVMVLDRECGDTNDFFLILDDLGNPLVCPPVDGLPYAPSNPLSSFVGAPAAGSWNLLIRDAAIGDNGFLDGFALQVCTDGGVVTPTPLPTRTPPPGCRIYDATLPAPLGIPDFGSAAVSVPVDMPGLVTSVTLLDLRGRHTFLQDLEMHLLSPGLRDVIFFDRECGETDDFFLTVDDLGNPFVCPPVDGLPYAPSNPLSGFNGATAAGTWRLEIYDRAPGDTGSLEGFALQICTDGDVPTPPPAPTCRSVRASDVPRAIPDLGSTESSLFLNLAGPVSYVQVQELTGQHTFQQDLEFVLVSPAGTEVAVMDRVCGGSPFGYRITLEDGAPTTIPCPPISVDPARPSNPLAAFFGQNAQGTWRMRVSDRATADTGTLDGWGLLVCVGGVPTPPPTLTRTPPPTLTAVPPLTRTPTRTFTARPSNTPLPSLTPSRTPTGTRPPTMTATRTGTATNTPTATPSLSATITATRTATPTVTRVPKITFTPTRTPTVTPVPTLTPAGTVTATRTGSPLGTATATRSGSPLGTPTATPTGSITTTRTPSATATRTSTGSPGTPTATRPSKATFTPTVTPTPGGPCGSCTGDCDCDGSVQINELITMVNIALESLPLQRCIIGDRNGDGRITIDEIVAAVNNALGVCLPVTPPTPAATATATATRTPGGGGEAGTRAGTGAALVAAQSLRAIPAVVSALTQIAGGSSLVTEDGGLVALAEEVDACLSGTRRYSCSQTTSGVPPRLYSLGFESCRLGAAYGTVALNGTLTGRSDESGFLATCSFPPLVLSQLSIPNVEVVARDPGGTSILSANFNVTGSASATPDLSSPCRIRALDLTFTGDATVTTSAAAVSLGFEATRLLVTVQEFSQPDCVPVRYTLTVNGPLSIDSPTFGDLRATFTDFVLGSDATTATESITLDGDITSDCFPGTVRYDTVSPLLWEPSSACPRGGILDLGIDPARDRILPTGAGGIQIDLGANGSIEQSYPTCTNPALRACN